MNRRTFIKAAAAAPIVQALPAPAAEEFVIVMCPFFGIAFPVPLPRSMFDNAFKAGAVLHLGNPSAVIVKDVIN